MEMIDESMSDSGLNELIKMADVDKDGRINYEGTIRHIIRFLINSINYFSFRVCQNAFVN